MEKYFLITYQEFCRAVVCLCMLACAFKLINNGKYRKKNRRDRVKYVN